ncbi:unnamed protein product, partial [Brassica napus]
MNCLILLSTIGFISSRCFYSPIQRRYSLRLTRPPPLRTVIGIGLISLCSVLESWDRVSKRSRRMEDLIFSISERFLPANQVGSVGAFPANLRGFVGALPEHLLHDVYFPHPVNPGEMQSFLKSPWPGDSDIVSIVHHSPSNSIMSFSVQRRTCLYEETRFAEKNQHLLQMALSTDSIDIHQPSWQQRISVRVGEWDKQKTKLSIYRSCKKRSIESTLLQRTRKRTTVSTFQSIVLDTMGFYYTIWKKQNAKMAYLSYQRR